MYLWKKHMQIEELCGLRETIFAILLQYYCILSDISGDVGIYGKVVKSLRVCEEVNEAQE